MVPDITACAAKCSACCEEPHWRSIEVAGTLSGSFEAMTALRAMLVDCSPACITQPMMTSSICAGVDAGALDQRVEHGGGADRPDASRRDALPCGRPRCERRRRYRPRPCLISLMFLDWAVLEDGPDLRGGSAFSQSIN